ncbi:type I restriction endonuclease subunit R [Arcobacter sp. 15-2]|uniref:type I restriction endonuclease subunit R n=1 Tax=Arcobacter sp. 15-2 TaxID=3374109 RepID=UPI00399D455F
MSTQSEAILEENLLKQLELLKYDRVVIKDDKALESNLKSQLEIHNKTTISDTEFKRILNHLNKGNVFEKAKILRDKYVLPCDDGTTKYIEFLDSEHWCQNLFQVTSQVTVDGVYKNRYDVTILINGFPLVQIELKRRGLELKEAFNQTLRYKRHSYSTNNALFNYIQLFIISNGVNTKYYANNKNIKELSFKQTFYWADKENKNITNIEEFTNDFLERCHLSKMICKYIVLAEVPKILMVLRPYQFHAVENIIDRVSNSQKNGYIWHTTGSGKTLTSFKTAQILMKLPKVHKVVFVVDRKDLDFQTTKEFNSFSDGSVDGTDNTSSLVKQFSDDTKLIVTTIQKLNTAISKKQYLSKMEKLQDKNIVFIFDECHRSQFGETHLNITKFFTHNQMIGFTGTPIFAENASNNALGKRTTKELFDDCLHKYVITDAINDDNVLKFSIEYIGKYKEKKDSTTNIDIEVEAIDTKELLESEDRLDKIVDYIIANHNRKTHSKEFTAMMCVSSVDMLIKYYELFKSKNHNLKIATIFSYSANEEDKDAKGEINLDDSDGPTVDETHINKHSREKLDEFITDYNKIFGSKFSTKDSQSFYNYYNDISKKVKQKEIDILLVVNMFLTGFDSKTLNTLYVDKNLKYHGLIQAFSRTNRILNEQKSQGNIVCFRNLKKNTDDAIALFSNKDAKEIIVMEPYEDYVLKFNEKYDILINLVPTIDSVNELDNEDDKLEFIKAFRDLMRVKNVLGGFSDFKWSDLKMSEQEFEDYKSKYLDMYEEIGKGGKGEGAEKVSILEDVDFELELIHKDEINVNYILKLLGQYKDTQDEEQRKKQKENISNILNNNPQLRSKRELIEQFINENLLQIKNSEDVEDEFEKFWDEQKEKAFEKLCKEDNLDNEKVKKVIDTYIYEQRKPLAHDVAQTLNDNYTYLKRKKIVPKVLDKIIGFVDKFFER